MASKLLKAVHQYCSICNAPWDQLKINGKMGLNTSKWSRMFHFKASWIIFFISPKYFLFSWAPASNFFGYRCGELNPHKSTVPLAISVVTVVGDGRGTWMSKGLSLSDAPKLGKFGTNENHCISLSAQGFPSSLKNDKVLGVFFFPSLTTWTWIS